MDKKKILIVEDDAPIKNLLKISLLNDNYDVLSTPSGKEAIIIVANENPAIILLDLGLPDLDGMEVIRRIREWSKIPIIVISARDQENDKIYALDVGADDYIQKPFSSKELSARIRATLRRSELFSDNIEQSVFQCGELKVDYSGHLIYLGDIEIKFTAIEFKIIALLTKNAGKVLTHNFIIKEVWGIGMADAQTLRVFIAGIRRKLENSLTAQRYIHTEIGIGYRMSIE